MGGMIYAAVMLQAVAFMLRSITGGISSLSALA
jgi:hypothetical protein